MTITITTPESYNLRFAKFNCAYLRVNFTDKPNI